MPCSDGQAWYAQEQAERKKKLENEVIRLKAICCALINEVDSGTIERAEKRGKVDIKSFVKEHKREDEKRMQELLKKLSIHELGLIKKILRE